MMPEKRTNARHRVLKAATIKFGGGAIDCMVRNMSGVGAALDVSSARRRRAAQALSYRLAQGKADRRGIRSQLSPARVQIRIHRELKKS
jgi:hypothetical protein